MITIARHTTPIVGLDLAGSEKRPTGYCRLNGLHVMTAELFSDLDIIGTVTQSKPAIVAVDAPLSLPPNRKSIDDVTGEHLRESDKELLRRRIRFFPITLGPMRKLTARGIELRCVLENSGFRVIEVYPGGAQDLLGIPRKQCGLEKLKAGLEDLGIRGLTNDLSHHELDAVTCAYVGKLFMEGSAEMYGPEKDAIIMPKGHAIFRRS